MIWLLPMDVEMCAGVRVTTNLLLGRHSIYWVPETNKVNRYLTPAQPLQNLADRLGPIQERESIHDAFECQYCGLVLKSCKSAGGE